MSRCTTSITFLCERVIKDHLNNLLAVLSLSDMACLYLRFTERLRSYCRHFELKHFSILLLAPTFENTGFHLGVVEIHGKYRFDKAFIAIKQKNEDFCFKSYMFAV